LIIVSEVILARPIAWPPTIGVFVIHLLTLRARGKVVDMCDDGGGGGGEGDGGVRVSHGYRIA
jgi:hypothetical protein